MKLRSALEVLGAALVLMMPYLAPLLLPLNIALYHHRLPLAHIAGGLLLDMLGAFLGGLGLMFLVSRLPPLPRRTTAAALAGLVFWRIADVIFKLVRLSRTNLESAGNPGGSSYSLFLHRLWGRMAPPFAVLLVLLLIVLALFRSQYAGRIVRAARLSLAAFAFSAMWIVPRLAGLMLPISAHGHVPVASEPASAHGARIIWVLFDELSYDLVFDHPPPGQQFPNFKKLRADSVSFANLEPVGFYTDRVIPSLLAGTSIGEIRSTLGGGLSYQDPAQHRWVMYNPAGTLFGLAHALGWNPGIAGWYNPYCRTFDGLLSACSWQPGIQVQLPMESLGASEDKSVLANALIVPRSIFRGWFAQANARDDRLNRDIHDYRAVMENASALIHDDRIGFVFVHLPVPHPPGIYDRKTRQLSESGNYLDNLALADDTMGILMQEMKSAPAANDTVIVVSSDHSWRVPLWRSGGAWSAEEEQVSHGQFDPRPVFLIHFPGQVSGEDIQGPMSEMIEHDVIAAMLKRQVSDQASLKAFLPPMAH